MEFYPNLNIKPIFNFCYLLYVIIVKFEEDKHTRLKGSLAYNDKIFSSYYIIMNCFLDTYLFFIFISESTDEPNMIVGLCFVLLR